MKIELVDKISLNKIINKNLKNNNTLINNKNILFFNFFIVLIFIFIILLLIYRFLEKNKNNEIV